MSRLRRQIFDVVPTGSFSPNITHNLRQTNGLSLNWFGMFWDDRKGFAQKRIYKSQITYLGFVDPLFRARKAMDRGDNSVFS